MLRPQRQLARVTLALSLGALAASAAEAGTLAVRPAGAIWEDRPLRLLVEPPPEASLLPLRCFVVSGADVVGEAVLPAGGGSVIIREPGLAAGRHLVFVRSGTLTGSTEVIVRPRRQAPAVAGLLFAAAAAFAALAARAARRSTVER